MVRAAFLASCTIARGNQRGGYVMKTWDHGIAPITDNMCCTLHHDSGFCVRCVLRAPLTGMHAAHAARRWLQLLPPHPPKKTSIAC